MGKARVATRLKEAVGGKKSHNQNENLARLTERYNVFAKRLHALIQALRAHYQAMVGISQSRIAVAQHLAVLAKDTPLYEKTAAMATAENPNVGTSYLSVHQGFAGKAKMYLTKYAQFVLDYALEWEKVVTSRVSAGLKKAQELRVELDHYQSKVESLRQSANATMAKGKQVDQKSADRLTRNEQKLVKIRQSHTKFVSDLCILMDEVTDRSWRDFHPLLVKIAQFDITMSGDEAKAMAALNTVVGELKQVAATHGIKPQARLKDLDNLDPTVLSTKAPGSNTLTIEAGVDALALDTPGGNSTLPPLPPTDNQHMPPGSVAPQGLGGFPVAVQSADNNSLSNGYPLARQSSYDTRSYDGSFASGMGQNPIPPLSINASAAPAPTVDQLDSAFGGTPRGAPGGGSLPPLGPPSASAPPSQGPRGRNHSTDSFDSSFSNLSGASAPPPAAPPPPPPSQFGSEGAANSNPFGPAPPAPAPAYGTNPFGAPATPTYGAPPPGVPSPGYGAPNPFGPGPNASPANYGQPSPVAAYGQPSPSYGQPPAYGQPSPTQGSGTNPFGM